MGAWQGQRSGPSADDAAENVIPISSKVRTAVVGEASPPPMLDPLRLVVLSGEQRGGVLSALGDTVVGRDETASLCLRHPSVSRRHAVLIRGREGWILEDCGSTNGTFVNGARLTEGVMLRHGDIIAFGAVVVKLHVSAGTPGGRSGLEAVHLDPRSGACTNAYLRKRLASDLARCYRLQRPISVLAMELDELDEPSGTRGPQAEDRLLREVANLLRARIRTSDLLAANGDRHFAVVLSEVPLPLGVRIARRLLQAMRDHTFGPPPTGLSITSSVGAASTEGRWLSAEALLCAAEDGMLRARLAGGNRIRA